MRTLDPTWRPLLGQVRDDRTLGFDADARPRPGSAQAAREFAAYGVKWAALHPAHRAITDTTERDDRPG